MIFVIHTSLIKSLLATNKTILIMKKITKILFPTDFSEASANALEYTLQLADSLKADICIMHCIYEEALDYPITVEQLTQQQIKVAREQMQIFIKTAIKKVDGLIKGFPAYSTTIESGSVTDSVNRLARQNDFDFIIIASRGKNRSLIEKIFGSVTESVIEKSIKPVLVIPENTVFKPIEKLVYATEVRNYTPFEIWKSVKLLSLDQPEVHVLHVDDTRGQGMIVKEKFDEMKAFFEGKEQKIQIQFHNTFSKNLNRQLNEFSKKMEANLLVLYQPPHSLWERLFLKSTTKEMSLHTNLPLLVFKDRY